MRQTDWRAFVRFKPEQPEAEWTREMDTEILRATGDEWGGTVDIGGSFHGLRDYATDLVAVVRAAEKWCDMHGWDRGWYLHHPSKQSHKDWPYEACVGGDAVAATTPALALAKALLAAIRAEKALPNLAMNSVSAPKIDEGALARIAGAPTKTPKVAISQDQMYCYDCGRIYNRGEYCACIGMVQTEKAVQRDIDTAKEAQAAWPKGMAAQVGESIDDWAKHHVESRLRGPGGPITARDDDYPNGRVGWGL